MDLEMFVTNRPKDLLRREYDVAAIRSKFQQPYDDITYFGMPGPSMLDVKEWGDYLGFIIAVENKTENLGIMQMTAGSLGLSDRTQILQGDVESILLNWEDDVGEIPGKDSFQVVNLDFEGGFIGFSNILVHDLRIDAIRELFRRQMHQQTSFLLFLTVGFREKRGQEYDLNLHHIREELAELGINAQDTINWYLSHGVKHKLKVYVPHLIEDYGRTFRFSLRAYRCFHYKGTGNVPMMHFIFDLKYSKRIVFPKRLSLKSILNCPLFQVYSDKVEASPVRPPLIVGGVESGFPSSRA